jgi:head-tail adaptor
MATQTARFRERVSIQQKNLIDNGRGGRARPAGGPEWIDVATDIGAEVIPLRGDEALQNAVLRSVQLYRITIRARTGVTITHRLMWGDVAMNIRAVALSVDRRDLVMSAEAGVPT